MKKICVITGPTASGKTALGVELALALDGEVVSADSMQVYRGMDIGTAKPTMEERRGVPHHMLDVAEPHEQYSAARYVREASACVDGILSREKLPIIVGGTMLYIDSLVRGRDFSERGDAELRKELSEEYDSLGGEEMLKRLHGIDPLRAEKLHPQDKRRIVRALEVFLFTGKTISRHDEETLKKPPRYDTIYAELSYENRQTLYRRIDERVDDMLRCGIIGEVRGLLLEGLSRACTSMQAIGYKEIASALLGDMSMDEAVERVKRESRRLAKRQMTWMRGRSDILRIRWGDSPNLSEARQTVTKFLERDD